MRYRALLCCVATLWAVPAFAQSTPRVELSGGYQFLNFSFEDQSESMPLGWYADVAGNLTPMFGLVFQVGGNYKSFEESQTIGGITARASVDLKVHEFLGGLRVNVRSNSAVVPFAHVLAGGINGSIKVSASATIPGQPPFSFEDSDSGTDLAMEVGGGANISLGGAVGIRVGMDYLRVFAEDSGANLFRFHAGVVINR